MTREYPRVNAAFLNALAEEGTKDDCLIMCRQLWDENCYLRGEIAKFVAAVAPPKTDNLN